MSGSRSRQVRSRFLLCRQTKGKSARRRLACEALETRDLLSADVGAAGAALELPPSGPPAWVADQSSGFALAIRGTGVEFSPLGLPAAMSGDVHVSGASGVAGRYQEALSPILMDINGDLVPDFVGTTGLATFEFFVGDSTTVAGSITTANVSFIQGMSPTGELSVGSTGQIVASAGVLSNLKGGFVSQSVVSLFPSFQLQTTVHFAVNRAVAPVLAALAHAGSPSQQAVATAVAFESSGEPASDGDAPAEEPVLAGKKARPAAPAAPAVAQRSGSEGLDAGAARRLAALASQASQPLDLTLDEAVEQLVAELAVA